MKKHNADFQFFHPETLRNISPGFVAFFDRICYNFSNMTENQRWIIPAAPVAEGACKKI